MEKIEQAVINLLGQNKSLCLLTADLEWNFLAALEHGLN